MNKIVLGGVGLANLSKIQLSNLMDYASSLGIDEIDTAPIYGDSELNIGRCLSGSNWKINTKFGQPNGTFISRKELLESVDNSLANLGIETIHTLFIHSLPASEVSIEVLDCMAQLRDSGKIQNLGYSGDSKNLKEIAERFPFDSLQASLNILDLTNYEMIQNNVGLKWYIKRTMCNQAFKLKPKLELVELYSRLRNKTKEDSSAYSFRYKRMFGNRLLSRMRSQEIFNFLLSLDLKASLIVGTTNTNHLQELCRISNEPEVWSEESLLNHFTKWQSLAEKYKWDSLV
jgi:aryl-alcohol dehydrogenase-like predicted oxidoreductase